MERRRSGQEGTCRRSGTGGTVIVRGPFGDLLEQEAVAVGVAERREGAVGQAARVQAGLPLLGTRVVEHAVRAIVGGVARIGVTVTGDDDISG
jgi:hypothetical protein